MVCGSFHPPNAHRSFSGAAFISIANVRRHLRGTEVLRDKPIAWLADGKVLVVQRVSERVVGDVVTPTCSATALYTFSVTT